VDLNRNYDFMWGELKGANTSGDECDNTYHGRNPFSEPETNTVADYAKQLFPAEQRRDDPEGSMDVAFGDDVMGIFVDVHAPGGYIIYPWTHDDSKTEDDDVGSFTISLYSFNSLPAKHVSRHLRKGIASNGTENELL